MSLSECKVEGKGKYTCGKQVSPTYEIGEEIKQSDDTLILLAHDPTPSNSMPHLQNADFVDDINNRYSAIWVGGFCYSNLTLSDLESIITIDTINNTYQLKNESYESWFLNPLNDIYPSNISSPDYAAIGFYELLPSTVAPLTCRLTRTINKSEIPDQSQF